MDSKKTDQQLKVEMIKSQENLGTNFNLSQFAKEQNIPITTAMNIQAQIPRAMFGNNEAVKNAYVYERLNTMMLAMEEQQGLLVDLKEQYHLCVEREDMNMALKIMDRYTKIISVINTIHTGLSQLLGANAPQQVEHKIMAQVKHDIQLHENKYVAIIGHATKKHPELMEVFAEIQEDIRAETKLIEAEMGKTVNEMSPLAKIGGPIDA